MILDVTMPELDGWATLERIRDLSDVPVLMLTARGGELDTVRGLRSGADDYLSKPFSPRELVLRVRSVLRRAGGEAVAPPEVLTDDGLEVLTGPRVARLHGRELTLTLREFDLLAHLMRHPARVFRRAELLDRVWGWSFGDQSTVTVHVRRLREKIEADPASPRRIVTVWGVGYRYEPADA